MKYSIIITAYNSEKYISKCLDSLVNQTNSNFSVIIIDDGSKDKTKEFIKPYFKKLNIQYYYKENTGVSDSRNYGINKVKTPYFLFVDSDDYVSIDLIETIEKYTNYDVLSFQSLKIDENDFLIQKLNKKVFEIVDGKNYLEALMKNKSYFFSSPWGYVFNKNFWIKNKFKFPDKYVMEDSGLIPMVLLQADKIISIDYYGYYYIQTSESIMRTKNSKKTNFRTKSILIQYDRLMNFINSKKIDNDFKVLFKDYFAGWLLWYGTTLEKKYLKQYIKELNSRNILKNLKMGSIKVIIKFILCRINYRFYFKLYNIFHN